MLPMEQLMKPLLLQGCGLHVIYTKDLQHDRQAKERQDLQVQRCAQKCILNLSNLSDGAQSNP